MASTTINAIVILLWVTLLGVPGLSAKQSPPEMPTLGRATSRGCFNSLGPILFTERRSVFNSVGWCVNQCKQGRQSAAALRQTRCLCIDTYPPLNALVVDNECDTPCPGYPMEACGGTQAYSIYNTGIDVDVEYYEDQGKDSIASSDSAWTKMADGRYDFSTALGDLTKSVQDFFSSCLGRQGSHGTKQASLGANVWKDSSLKGL